MHDMREGEKVTSWVSCGGFGGRCEKACAKMHVTWPKNCLRDATWEQSARFGKTRQKPERLEAQGKPIRCPVTVPNTERKKVRVGGREKKGARAPREKNEGCKARLSHLGEEKDENEEWKVIFYYMYLGI